MGLRLLLENPHVRNAARDALLVYATFCLFAACVSLTIAGDHYGLWSNDRPPNDAPLVKDVEQGVDDVFEALEVIVNEVGELVKGASNE